MPVHPPWFDPRLYGVGLPRTWGSRERAHRDIDTPERPSCQWKNHAKSMRYHCQPPVVMRRHGDLNMSAHGNVVTSPIADDTPVKLPPALLGRRQHSPRPSPVDPPTCRHGEVTTSPCRRMVWTRWPQRMNRSRARSQAAAARLGSTLSGVRKPSWKIITSLPVKRLLAE